MGPGTLFVLLHLRCGQETWHHFYNWLFQTLENLMLVSAVLLMETVSIQHVLCLTVNLLTMPCLAVTRFRKEQRHCLIPSSGRAQLPRRTLETDLLLGDYVVLANKFLRGQTVYCRNERHVWTTVTVANRHLLIVSLRLNWRRINWKISLHSPASQIPFLWVFVCIRVHVCKWSTASI